MAALKPKKRRLQRADTIMATIYSTLSREERIREVRSLKKAAEKINSSPRTARAFLIKAGILSKSGRGLAPQYR